MRQLLVLSLLMPSLPSPALAADTRVMAGVPHCVEVEVNGERIQDYECLGRLLAPTAQSGAPVAASLASERIATRPPSALGLATPEATRQRMGNTFGRSTLPQRPPPAPAPAPIVRRP